jgi:hypothetical protein
VFIGEASLARLRASGEFEVMEKAQFRNGGRCVVVRHKSGRGLLYFDAERPTCLLERCTLDLDQKSLITRWEFAKHRELMPNVWVPYSVRRIEFDSRKPNGTAAGRILMDVTVSVDAISLNDVTEDIAAPLRLKGELELGTTADEKAPVQSNLEGKEMLDEQAHVMKCESDRARKVPGRTNFLLWATSILAGATCGGWAGRRVNGFQLWGGSRK